MSSMELYLAIAVMAAVNFLTRITPFLFFRKHEHPWYINFVEKYFPATIMTILVFYSIKDISFMVEPYGMQEIGGIIFTALLHLILKNYLISIFGGTIFYMAMIQYL